MRPLNSPSGLASQHDIMNGAPSSIGSRSRFIVNSMFCDCRWRQLSTSVWYRCLGKRSEYSAASFLAAVRSRVNFSRINGVSGHALLKRSSAGQAIDP